MTTAAREAQIIERHSFIQARVVVFWLVVGAAMVTAGVALGGWQRVAQVWAGSAVGLFLLLLYERGVHGREKFPDSRRHE
jgi:hypothetical protein